MRQRIGPLRQSNVRVQTSRTALVAMLIAVSVVAFWTVGPQLPTNILEFPRGNPIERVLAGAFPQGWAFFTRTPHEDQYRAFRASTTGHPAVALDRNPYSEVDNAFGIDRTSRQQVPELDDVVSQLHDGDWHSCRSDDECLQLPTKPVAVTNSVMHQTYCGPVTLIAFTVTPWAFRNLVPTPWVDSRAAKLDIQCTTA